MPERRYALIKIDAGSYLLHGNDVEGTLPGDEGIGTMFRLTRWEDGPEFGAERRRTRWTLTQTPWGPLRRAINADFGNPLDEVPWEFVDEFDTRTDAVNEAVRLSDARRKVAS